MMSDLNKPVVANDNVPIVKRSASQWLWAIYELLKEEGVPAKLVEFITQRSSHLEVITHKKFDIQVFDGQIKIYQEISMPYTKPDGTVVQMGVDLASDAIFKIELSDPECIEKAVTYMKECK